MLQRSKLVGDHAAVIVVLVHLNFTKTEDEVRRPAVTGQALGPAREVPILPAAADYTVSVIADIAERYLVDGIHLDYARFPNDDFDYSPAALSRFRAEIRSRMTRDERREYGSRGKDRPMFYKIGRASCRERV